MDDHSPMTTIDPVGNRYFKPLLLADSVLDGLFYTSAALSLLTPLLDRSKSPFWYDVAQGAFALAVLAYFLLGLAIRLYFSPRAQNGRYRDFLSHALNKPLDFEKSDGYYNNAQRTEKGRITAQVFESSFFTKNILSVMAVRERIKLVIYVVLWLLVIFYRASDLAFVAIFAQIIFSEQIASRCARLEWLRFRSERVYEELYRAFQTKADLKIISLEYLGLYEMAKATAAISLSTSIFDQHREAWNREWDQIRSALNL